jgi:hypothetical protein
MKFSNAIRFFVKPNSYQLALKDLEESRKDFLYYKSSEERSRNMVKFLSEKIIRLESYTNQEQNYMREERQNRAKQLRQQKLLNQKD